MRKIRLAVVSMLIAFGLIAAVPTPAHALGLTVHNNNVSIYLQVLDGNGRQYTIAPRAKASIGSGPHSRSVRIWNGCRLEKDGKPFGTGGPWVWKNFGWQPSEVDFFHFC